MSQAFEKQKTFVKDGPRDFRFDQRGNVRLYTP